MSILLMSTIVFGLVETHEFSAYAACRRIVMTVKGYGVWKHIGTDQFIFMSFMKFYDDGNYLSCSAIGIGPFWVASRGFQTIRGCIRNAQGVSPCPEDYFGVSP